MTQLAAVQASMDFNLYASQLRFTATQTSMIFKLDLIILKLDTMIPLQRSPFCSSVQPPSLPPPPAPPSNAYSYHPSQYPPPPRPHVPPSQFTPHSHVPPQLYPQEWGNPNCPMLPPLPMLLAISCPTPRQQSPTPIPTPLPMAGKGNGPAIGIDFGTTYFPIRVCQHHRVDINHLF